MYSIGHHFLGHLIAIPYTWSYDILLVKKVGGVARHKGNSFQRDNSNTFVNWFLIIIGKIPTYFVEHQLIFYYSFKLITKKIPTT